MKGLNEVQREAVLHEGAPLLILAGAGSGKTRVLMHKIAYLIGEKNVAPERILALTFTNKAAGEMRERMSALLHIENSPSIWNELWMGTFHSIGLKMIRENTALLDIGGEVAVYDNHDQVDVIKTCLKKMGGKAADIKPSAIASFINRLKCFPSDAKIEKKGGYFEEMAFEVYKLYERELKANGALDFGDLLIKPLELLRSNPSLLSRYHDRFRYIFVDEYQDTNPVQYELLKLLSSGNAELTVVGDEDQSIYRFRGADIGNILEFKNDFPNATILRLEQNYRSTQTILHAANAVVSNNVERLGKTLWSDLGEGDKVTLYAAQKDRDEAAFVIKEVAKLSQSVPLDQIAIFYRTNAQSRLFEEECRYRNIPYKIYGGLNFFERKEVKDVIAYLRILVNPRDAVSLKRIINVPVRGIGKTSLDQLDAMANERGMPLLQFMGENMAILGPRVKTSLERFLSLYMRLRAASQGGSPLLSFVQMLIKETGYEAMLKSEGSIEGESRLENLDEFLNAVGDYETRVEKPTLSGFLDGITLDTSRSEGNEAERALPLMTLHLSKGLEFPYVFVVGLEENLLPHFRALENGDDIEEERRLLYVGMTRAMKKLTLSYSIERYVHGREHRNLKSRFIRELPREVLREEGVGRSSFLPREVPKPVLKRAPSSHPYGIGKLVRHPVFGRGVIHSMEDGGEHVDNPRVTIVFEKGGMKRLLGKYANLEML